MLRGERVTLRPVAAADVDRLAAVLREPSVARWWGTQAPAESAREANSAVSTSWRYSSYVHFDSRASRASVS